MLNRKNFVQPPHYIAEVAAVLVPKKPDEAEYNLVGLLKLKMSFVTNPAVYLQAINFCSVLNHHLFDTLYHAVALVNNITLITADNTYYEKAKGFGKIELLAQLH